MLKRFISYYRPHWKLFCLDITCAFLITGIDLLFPIITRNFINDIIPNGKFELFWKFSFFLLILYILRTILQYILEYWGHVVGVRMEADMRRDLFTHLQTLSFSFFDKSRTGNLMSRVVNDLNNICETAHHGPEDLFISLMMLGGSFLVLININVPLTLLIFGLIPFIVWFSAKKRIKMMNGFRNVRREVADINSELENSIAGIRVAKAFTNEEYELNKFTKKNISLQKSRENAYKAMAEFFSGINFMSNLLKLIVLVVGGYFVFENKINYGDLVAYLLYIQLFLTPIRSLTQLMQQYQQAIAGFERFLEIMEVKPEIQDKEDAKELKDVKGEIIFENVTFSYDNKEKVLKNINLKIEAGKTLALVGPSGGGKSTLCNLIPRFYEVESGRILIDGHPITDIKISSLRRNIGIVQQDVFLFSGTIRENILYGRLDATEEEIIEAAKNANIHDFIMQLPDQYDTYVGERGIRLSGGQKQRISIARVFLKNPPILILDEATSSLDNESELIIQQALRRLAKNRTTLVIAHRLSTIKDADQIVVLTENGIQEQGTHQQLLARNGLYASLYNAQFREYSA
ncbi:thiamine ABC transporter permease [Anoxybacter fermentans]|uniref:Thiamine ABC transporter permease n=1 Tax=Anoxybacter fermentans TaxID=1323375 RepID=A0A3Q9HQP5_9FIRM|nr:ABC transporter ATP-binding protein [Anoxybacter fermentans]AZR73413.1 thiamine ABC transporter permease [Anoxybacter fermentans]